MGVGTVRQDARDILQQPASGDVGQRVDPACTDQGQQARDIDAGRCDQRVDQKLVLIEQGGAVQLPALVRRQTPYQRIAVGVHAARSKAQQHIARGNLVAGQLLAAFHRADAEAGEVVVARRIHPRHFRRLAADQRASGHLAAFGDAGDHAFRDAVLQLAGGEIIEEEQRLCALHDQIVDAHGDQIDADRVMAVMLDGELQLGPDTVIGGDQQGITISGGLGVEEPAEAAKLAGCARTRGGLRQRADGLDQRVAGRDRYACIGIGVARALRLALVCPRSHARRHSGSRLEFHSPLGKGLAISP